MNNPIFITLDAILCNEPLFHTTVCGDKITLLYIEVVPEVTKPPLPPKPKYYYVIAINQALDILKGWDYPTSSKQIRDAIIDTWAIYTAR